MRTLKALWQSFYSRRFYAEAHRSWKGIGFLLLAVLVLLQTIIISFKIHVGIGSFARNTAPAIIKQLPEITFSKGLASTPEAKAYEIIEPESGKAIAIIDTRLEHPPSDLGGAHAFLAQKSVTFKKSSYENRSYDFKTIQEFVLNEAVVNYWLNITANWTAAVCAPFILGFYMVYRMLQLLFFSLLALAIAAILKLSGGYAALLRLTALALTPAILLLGILPSALSLDFPGIRILFFAVVVAYLFLGINAARRQQITPPPHL